MYSVNCFRRVLLDVGGKKTIISVPHEMSETEVNKVMVVTRAYLQQYVYVEMILAECFIQKIEKSILKKKCVRFEVKKKWVDCKKNHTVGVGLPLKPGIVFKSQPEYRNVVKHVEKGDRRNDGIDLCIVDECVRQLPIVHWLKTPDHGCPKTIRRIEACEDGAVDIYEGERLVRHVTAEELELKQSKTINTEEV